MQSRLILKFCVSLCATFIYASVLLAQKTEKPNIVFILADDLGYGDLTCYNQQSKIRTPHIDRLARQGIRFTDAHSASSVCTPSRYAALTGRYAWRTALKNQVFYNYEPPLIEAERMTIARMLKNEGYRTAAIGKWHLGLEWRTKPGQHFNFMKPFPWPGGTLPMEEEKKIDFTAPVKGGPVELGFDYFFGTSACATCNTPYCYIENDRIVSQPTEYFKGRYLEQRGGFRSPEFQEATVDSIFTVKAMDFIVKSKKDKKPFFLYLAASAPHEPAEEDVVPAFLRGKSEAGPRGDLVVYFDWMVGKIMESLQKAGVSKNTIVIVTSDNGAKPGNYNRITHDHKSNGNLRGFKGGIWEGGHRIPFIVRLPAGSRKGATSSHFIGLQDIMSTIADLLGIELPGDSAEDSISFLYALSDEGKSEKKNGRKDIVFHSTSGVFAIREGDWKLIVDCDNSGDGGRGVHGNEGTGPKSSMKGQLYNLADDPYELFNLIDKNKEKELALRELLMRYREQGRSRAFKSN